MHLQKVGANELPTKWLLYILYVSIAIDLVSVISGLLQFRLLSQIQAGAYSSQAAMLAAATANDNRQRLVALVQVGVYVITVVIFCIWIYKANKSARRFGAQGMEFTPGWSVGYYFIPFANLWMPYQAMKEIWLVSKSPTSWQNTKRGIVLPAWWAFWIFNGIVGYISLMVSLGANTVFQLMDVSTMQVISRVVDIIAILLAVALVSQINTMQLRCRAQEKRL